jgi:DNA (cytosine-5)-methyltransferase 1
MLHMLSLCSGIGGLDLAAEATGAIQTVAFAETEPFCARVLAYHWSGIPNLGDMHGITRDTLRAAGVDPDGVDIVCGGIPCQGNSVAGTRRGRTDERNLWPATAAILRETRPRWVVVENVSGILSASVDRRGRTDAGVFGDILRDLATLGYAAGWMVYGATHVGAPHRRDRVFLLACLADACRSRYSLWHGSADTGATPTTATGAPARQTEPGVGDDSDGFPGGLARYPCWHGWPSGPTESQADWEPPRTVTGRVAERGAKLKALGNAVVPQQAYPVFAAIVAAERQRGAV